MACDTSDDCQGVDCLPEATQTGAGTFGCLVNGEPFVDNSGSFNCYYQFNNGNYYFNISGEFNSKVPLIISLATNGLAISSNSSYQLLDESQGNFYAEVTFDNNPPTFLNDNTTDNNNSGLITIDQIDYTTNIVSGTFSFEIVDEENGKVYTISDGRFDSFFTQ
ncbi:MAG: hypothetical protein AB8B52_13765 [Winogradskyella sp.]|uniref:hypothetical protein n=1 Tax=Winogradskyella sp. TaxID=1883156 RepID=UPI00385AB79B